MSQTPQHARCAFVCALLGLVGSVCACSRGEREPDAVETLAPEVGAETEPRPSFDCAQATDAVEQAICKSPELSGLDRRLSQVFNTVDGRTEGLARDKLRSEQQEWLNRRNDCWKEADAEACARQEYQVRIVNLQVSHKLVRPRYRQRFICQHNETLYVTYFETDTPSVRLERAGDTLIAAQVPITVAPGARQPNRSVTKYAGPFGTSFLTEEEAAVLTWPEGHPVPCKR